MPTPAIFVPTGAWNYRAGVSAEEVLEAARKAEAAGIDGLFAGDHVTFYGAGNDGLINLAAVAAVTERIQLLTSVYLLALRHPTPVALQCAMVDQLSRGRLVLGVGIGGEDPQEYRACGVDPRTRGTRADEALQILRRLWTEPEVTFKGRHFQLEGTRLEPKPFRPEGIPLYVGGRSDAALRRAALYGDGWIGIWNSVRRLREAREKMDAWAAEAGRSGAEIGLAMQVWVGVDRDVEKARQGLARRMEGFYRIPFQSFEKYVAYGPPEAVAEFLALYVEAGCRDIHLVAAQESQGAVIDAGVAVKEALARIFAP